MIKLVAFDWNGTLLADTFQTWKVSSYTFKKIGLKEISFKKFQETFDVPIMLFYFRNGMSKSDFKKKARLQAETFHERYEKLAVKIRSRGGARDLLRWLKENKIASAIYSNHTTLGVNNQLKRLKLESLIHKVLANPHRHSAQLKRGKQQRLKEYIKHHNLKPHEVISIGDTCEEIEIGKSLGLHTVAITAGFHSTARLKAAKPDFLIHNMKELIPIIKKLNS